MIYNVIIVGTGPSGVAAAYGLAEKGIVPLILDVGFEAPDVKPLNSNIYDYRKAHDSFNFMIGKNYEALKHVINKRTPSPKISSPYMQFVTKDAEKLSPLEEKSLPILQSFAMGGLANAWGAGLFRCIDSDLVNLPIKAADLFTYYDKLTDEIGICGDNDDLTQFFGSTEKLLKPLTFSKMAEKLYCNYKKKKQKLNSQGVYIGRSRIGFLTENYDHRPAYKHHNLEMWFPNLPYFYTPTYTLQKLIKKDKVIYKSSLIVKRWTRKDNQLVVHAQDVKSGIATSFKCKKLILAAGTINSSKIVLNSKEDFTTKLPMLDKSLVQVPLIYPSFIGRKFDTEAFGSTYLNIVFDFKEFNLKLQGSIIELTSPARAVFYEMFPFAARDNVNFIRQFVPSVSILFTWFPSDKENAGYLMLKTANKLEVYSPPAKLNKRVTDKIVKAFMSMGVFTHSLLVRPPDHSLQYAGTLPMVENPDREYQCDKMGQIFGEPGVHVVDGSLFSYMPSKNFGLTLMANAMRISDHIADTLKGQ